MNTFVMILSITGSQNDQHLLAPFQHHCCFSIAKKILYTSRSLLLFFYRYSFLSIHLLKWLLWILSIVSFELFLSSLL